LKFFSRPVFLFLALVLIAAPATRAQITPRPDETKTIGQRVPDVTLLGEDSTTFTLGSLAGKPIVVSPIFTACEQTCPMITASLRDALAQIGEPGAGYQVLTISFDPADGPAELREYRLKMALPPGWKLAVATPENLQQLLDAIDFNYETLPDGGFVHANVIAVLSRALTVSNYVHGVSYDAAGIRHALEQAADETSLVRHYRPYIVGAAIAAWSSVVVVLITTRKKRRHAQKK
jgi:protein SCO1/2